MNDAAHPKAQTMAAFLEGTLGKDEIAYVADHLRTCGDCRIVVAETARFEREEEQLQARMPRRTWWLAAAAMLAALAVTVPLLRWNERRQASPIAHLIEVAPKEHRFVEARLSGFPWARLQAPSRGEPVADPADLKLAGAAGEVLEQTQERNEPAARHASGVALLLIGRHADSIATLEHAVRGAGHARAWNDLAAARYALAVRDERPAQLPLALADVDRALRLDPALAEAYFNRALILERMGLSSHARKAWQRYLEVDPGSEWSAEAREHVRRLGRGAARFEPAMLDRLTPAELARQFPQETRTRAEGPLLAAWGDAVAANDTTGAAAASARVAALAGALRDANGEQLLADAVAAIEHADADGRMTLALGHRTYRDARIQYSGRRPGAAEKQFREAAALFARGGSPMAFLARYYAASAAFDQSRTDEAYAELTELLGRVDARRHRALAGQLHWQLAVCANASGDWGAATRHADAGAALFHALGESANAAFLDGLAAMALELIGEPDPAWRRRVRAFAGLDGSPDRLGTILHSSAFTLASLGRDSAAASLVELKLDGGGNDDPARLSYSRADGARFAARSGDGVRGRQLLAAARTDAARVSDAALRGTVSAYVKLAEATLHGTDEPRLAIASLDRTINLFASSQNNADLPDAYLQRGRAFRSARDDRSAAADYTEALRVIDKQRASIRDAESRLRFLDTATQVIEEIIDLRLAQGDVAGAFAAADRARSLLGDAPGRDGAATSVAEGTVLVEYAVLPRSIVAFRVTADGITAARTQTSREELAERVSTLAGRIRRRAPLEDVRSEAAALHRMLIEPLRLANVRELVIVPDRELHAVPFAALWNERTKKYLAEEVVIRFAPSASYGGDEAGPLGPALVMADPPAPPLARLPASREEAANIATLHGAALLAGDAATRAAFLDAAPRSALIHFAGHANSDASTSYGALLFAGGGIVSSGDVARLRLNRSPLVVLAGCGTFRGDALHVAGMSSLSRAFLAAGARGVVGTLWEIDDDVSAPLFLELHQQLRAGRAPSRALREAQLRLLHSSDSRLAHPAAWSPVEYLGNL